MGKHLNSTKKEVPEKPSNSNGENSISRRKFIGGVGSVALGLSIVPAHVLAGSKHTAPSDKINVAYIGLGTQGLRVMPTLLQNPDVHVSAVCDPQRKAIDYYDWGPTSLLDQMRKFIGNPNWTTGGNNTIPGGLNNGKEIVDAYYSNTGLNYKCKAYTDFRELFEKENDIDAIQVMTPDHLHGVIAMAALKRGIHVTMHKPISNRLIEGYKVIEKAKQTDTITHMMAWGGKEGMDKIMSWINSGTIGELKEIHNWSRRPVWPHYAQKPTDTPKLPEGFDWDLWLGPEADRPYHPNYTNMVFRGWYDFGGGSMADMGHYSLWTVFDALKLEKPTVIETNLSHVCSIKDNLMAFKIENDFSFPYASSVRFKYPANKNRNAVDLCWYDGGMKPPVPEEFYKNNKEFPDEGMMFIGTKGIIMSSGFRVKDPFILSGDIKLAEAVSAAEGAVSKGKNNGFIGAIKNNEQIVGNFRMAWPITEAVNLYAAALRARKTLLYDANAMKITNDKKANEYLNRKYRSGWGLDEI